MYDCQGCSEDDKIGAIDQRCYLCGRNCAKFRMSSKSTDMPIICYQEIVEYMRRLRTWIRKVFGTVKEKIKWS